MEKIGSMDAMKTYTVSYTLSQYVNLSHLKQSLLEIHDVHSKSVGRKAVWVRLPPPAPYFLQRLIIY
jgi:hypothetical protein